MQVYLQKLNVYLEPWYRPEKVSTVSDQTSKAGAARVSISELNPSQHP